MNLMFDTNVLLDVFRGRHPFADHSGAALHTVVSGEHRGMVPAHGLTTVYYLLRKHSGHSVAIDTVDWVLRRFAIAPATSEIFLRARGLQMRDFEDAVVAAMANAANCDYIITRNIGDFVGCGTAAVAPEEFLRRTRPQ
ncbi:MAG: PIN domain-containing protein [Candidatus Hydrogenedentes bacterium]|nr:PIN domain-containing protein [Candidatus Hydrogenedentota bacterium]